MPLADTLRRLPPAAEDFARSLFDHHWFEASWLYERREILRIQGPLVSADAWLEQEKRADAHVVALAKGGALVLGECESKALEGNLGELNTAIRLLCRTDQAERFNDLIERIDWQEPKRAEAVTDALAWDAPDSWQELVGALLEDESLTDGAIGPLARVVGLRAWPLGEALLGVLEDRVGDLEAVAWAIGVLRVNEALPELYAVIQEDHAPAVRQAAAIAALRFAPGEVLAYLEKVVAQEDWAAIPLAIGGGPRVWGTLSKVAKESPSAEKMLAVGLFGYVGGIEILLEMVEHEEYGAAAAEGLYILTGAPLHEETSERSSSDEPDDKTESEGEDEAEQPGLLVSQLPRSREPWIAWLKENDARLRAQMQVRIRRGVSYEPQLSLDEIETTNVSAPVRQWMIEELDIRYRSSSKTWPRLSRSAQRRSTCRTRTDLISRSKFATGDWYTDGQPPGLTRKVTQSNPPVF
ncbi:MAG: hypothetical protein AAGF11_37445 [Myxococcota bacterium]